MVCSLGFRTLTSSLPSVACTHLSWPLDLRLICSHADSETKAASQSTKEIYVCPSLKRHDLLSMKNIVL